MSLVKQAIILEIKEYASKALNLKSKMDSSKTEVKRALYFKKLKKNNTEAAQLFEALARLEAKEGAGVELGVDDEISVLEGRAEEASSPIETVE